MSILLSILVPTRGPRIDYYHILMKHILSIRGDRKYIEIISLMDTATTAEGGRWHNEKFNKLLDWASGKYLMFVHDDDWVDTSLLNEVVPVMEQDPDQILYWLKVIYQDGRTNTCKPEHGERDMRSGTPGMNDYYAHPQTFNIWRSEFAKQVKFEPMSAEDCNWTAAVDVMCLNSVTIPKELYHYRLGYPKG